MRVKKIDNCISVVTTTSNFLLPFRLQVWLYVVDGVLIDTGANNTVKVINRLSQQEKINCAAITHIHEDHTGGGAWIKNNLKIPVYLPANSIPEAAIKTSLPLYRRLPWGNREAFIADPMPPFIETEKVRLDVIATPGHHKDHVIFYEKNKGWIFTGDVFVNRQQKVALGDENIGDAIKSLSKLTQLNIDKMFCAHSGIHDDGKEKLQAKLDFLLDLQHKVNTLKKEGLSLEEIDKRLFPKKHSWTFVSHGEWSTFNIVRTI